MTVMKGILSRVPHLNIRMIGRSFVHDVLAMLAALKSLKREIVKLGIMQMPLITIEPNPIERPCR